MITTDPVADRYASAFFELVRDEGHLERASRELEELANLIQNHKDLRQFLENPDVEATEKLTVLDHIRREPWSSEVRAFVQMVVSMGRTEYLGEIIDAFRALVDEANRLLRVTVRTAHPLSDPLKARLKQRLEQRENRHVELTEEADPALIGGIQVLLGHRMLDGSLKTTLAQLQQRLKAVRVH